MSVDLQKLLVALIAALILVSAAGYAAIYSQLSDLEGRVDETGRELEELQRAIRDVEGELERLKSEAASTGDLERIAAQVDALTEAVEELRRGGATVEDLEEIAARVAELSAALEDLREALESSREASEEALSRIDELAARLDELRASVEDLAESILFPVELVDGTGSIVVVTSRPERIVSMAPSVTEILYYVGALDRLVGVDDYSDWPPEVAEARERGEIASIGGFWDPSIEAILSLQPDLVIGVATAPPHIQVKEILESYGIPVLLLPSETLDDVKNSLILVGKATGNVVEAYKAASMFEAAVSAARALLGGAEGVRVAVIVWLEPLFVVGWGNWEHDILTALGAVNVYGDEGDPNLKGWPVVSVESLVERAPDVIVVMGGHGGMTPSDFVDWLESQLGEAAYDIPAVSDGRVYVLQGLYNDVFARPSPRTSLAVYVFLAILSPETLGLEEVPGVVSPETLDVLSLLEGRVPDDVLAFLGEALS